MSPKLELNMKYYLLFLLFPFILYGEPNVESLDPNMALQKVDANGISWNDPRQGNFRLSGFPWVKKDKVYRRLPVKPDWEITKPVNSLAWHTSGGQIAFKTNSPKILVKVELRSKSGMYHMPPTGQSGCDLYLLKNGKWNYVKTSRFGEAAKDYQVILLEGTDKGEKEVLINLPLYNGVNSIKIGLQQGSSLKTPSPFKKNGTIVFYGTSITQGGCASRPGMSYTNILGRRLFSDVINLGFSGNGKGEPAMAHLINQIPNKSMIVLDYEANTYEDIKRTLEKFIDILREKNPKIPIVVLSKIIYAREINDSDILNQLIARAEWQKNLVNKKAQAGDQNLYFINGQDLLGENAAECTVDGVHPTDLGFMRMADSLEPKFSSLLN